MLIAELEEFIEKLPTKGRLLGLDHGSKTIGVATSDVERSIASPVETISRKKFSVDLEQLKRHVSDQHAIGFIVGYPLNMDGSEGPRCQSVRAFVRHLEDHFNLPILFWDERLSSHAADDAMLQANLSRKKREENIDKVAAAFILQSSLDKMNQLR